MAVFCGISRNVTTLLTLLLRLCLLISIECDPDGNIVEYAPHCQGVFAQEDLYNYTCVETGEGLTLTCPNNTIVVATVCLGQSQNNDTAKDVCEISDNDCYMDYRYAMRSVRMIHNIKQCLWKKRTCEIVPPHIRGSHKYWGNPCTAKDYNYVAVFNFHCLADSIVTDICQNLSFNSSSNVGYIRSPEFPDTANIERNCSKKFIFGDVKKFNFWIQHIQLANEDYVRIDSIDKDNLIIPGRKWQSTSGASQNYSAEGVGFAVSYVSYGYKVNGFLISYTVTMADTTNYHQALPSVAQNTRSQDEDGRSPLEKTGIAMSVLFTLTMTVLMAILLLYIKMKVQREPVYRSAPLRRETSQRDKNGPLTDEEIRSRDMFEI